MTIKKITYATTLIGLGSLLAIGSFAPAALAETTKVSQTKSEQSSGTLRQGLPGRRLGGGTRQDGKVFTDEYSYLAALTPSSNLSITTAERPTLMFYIPNMVTEQTGELVIRNENDDMVYESTFQIDREGGIVGFNTAEDAAMPVLALDETYRWYFSIIPDVTARSTDIVVNGNIRRVDSEAWLDEQSVDSAQITALGETNPLMQARVLYQEADLWHDAALILDELRQANPQNEAIAAEWDQLIERIGLTAVVELPEPTVQLGLN